MNIHMNIKQFLAETKGLISRVMHVGLWEHECDVKFKIPYKGPFINYVTH